ncbi:MAG: methyltransferase family protein [Vulcanimicrobiaceae bacterium]
MTPKPAGDVPSPWWYRFRGWVLGGVIYLAIYLAFGIAHALPIERRPIYQLFGAAGEQWVFAASFLLAAACWLLRVWGASCLRPSIVWSRDARTDSLVVTGPFRYTRNPLYLANLLLVAAVGAFGPPIGVPILLLCAFVFIEALIAFEERELGERYGAAFERYRAQVPQILPRLVPVPGNAPSPGLTRDGFLGETLAGCYALSMLVLAVFGAYAWRYAFAVALLGVVVQRFAVRLTER